MFLVLKKLMERHWLVFAFVCVSKALLLAFTAQPIPTGDEYFYDGAVVHALNGGSYANPALALVLPISGNEVFSAYPPLHQAVLWLWMDVWGTDVLSAQWFQLVIFIIYAAGVISILRGLKVPGFWVNIGALFLFGITFLDRPDTLAFACGIWSLFAWLKAFKLGWTNAAGNRWSLIAAALMVLTMCTSLHIGAMFILWGALMALAVSGSKRIAFPIVPIAMTIVVLICLGGVVRFQYSRLWAGFQEHVRETPTLAGWTIPQPGNLLARIMLKLLRTAPGLLAVVMLSTIFAVQDKKGAMALAKTERGITLWSGLLITMTMFVASFCFLMQGPVQWFAYLQPLLVALFPFAIKIPALSDRGQVLWLRVCVALAMIGGVRVFGMATWGVVCCADVSQGEALTIIRKALDKAPPGSTVIASSAFLYEGDRHKSLRVLHADWLASHRHESDLVQRITELRPECMVLTQFDYYRGCGIELPILRTRPEVAELRIRNMAAVRPPDAFGYFGRVVQHVSWAPVIVDFKWK